MKINKKHLLILGISFMIFIGCGGSSDNSSEHAENEIEMQAEQEETIINNAPVINQSLPSISEQNIIQGERLDFAVVATDPDGDDLHYNWSISAGVLDETEDSFAVWTAPDEAVDVTVKVIVSDDYDNSTTTSWDIEVVEKQADSEPRGELIRQLDVVGDGKTPVPSTDVYIDWNPPIVVVDREVKNACVYQYLIGATTTDSCEFIKIIAEVRSTKTEYYEEVQEITKVLGLDWDDFAESPDNFFYLWVYVVNCNGVTGDPTGILVRDITGPGLEIE